MPKLTRKDWEMLRDGYHIAFSSWESDDFKALLDSAYSESNPGSNPANPGELDNTDALMIGLVHSEPPIVPGG